MYDWEIEEVQDYIMNNSRNNFVFIQYTYKQLGRSETWFKKQCRDLDMDRFLIKREILLEWTKSSEMSVFGEAELDRLYDNIKEIKAELLIQKYFKINIYKDIDFRKPYIIGVDCATGMEQDYSTIVICDPHNDMEPIATFRNNVIDTIEFANVLYELVKRYFTNSVLVIERNSVGKAIIDYLLKTDISSRLYFSYKTVKAEKRLSDGMIQKTKTKTKVYGITTDKETRPKMLDLLRYIVNESYENINSKELVDEIAGLERDNKGKIGHSPTGHDDLVFGFLLAQYVWAYGERLNEFGIYKSSSFTIQSQIKALDEDEYNADLIRKMTSVTKYNRDYSINSDIISANSFIDKYYREQEYNREREMEERQAISHNIINSLLDIYEN